MNENKHDTSTNWVDEDDAPELTDAFFEQADEYNNGVLIRRGSAAVFDESNLVHLDADILAAFKAMGKDWQLRLNGVLREWVIAHPSF
jgi:uncharacterized protein (DUF4415 family)